MSIYDRSDDSHTEMMLSPGGRRSHPWNKVAAQAWPESLMCPGATINDQGPGGFAILLGFPSSPKPKQTLVLGSLHGVLQFEVALRQ